ncbi:hypothetical protein L4C34_04100 [Vibrio profundum]|uniref:hypothetical protein n=1 Tax=Vibrio profundum TaxID=2910247 RepID=UPI003D13BCF1
MAGVDFGIYYEMKRMNLSKGDFSLPFTLRSSPVTLQVSRKTIDAQTIERLRVSLKSMQQDGTLRTVVQRYFGDYYRYLIADSDKE